MGGYYFPPIQHDASEGEFFLQTTEHYQLNQWEGSDRILRTDFNADNRKTEEALTELAGTVAKKVGQAEVDAALQWVKIGEQVLSGSAYEIPVAISNAQDYRFFLIVFNISGAQTVGFRWTGYNDGISLGYVDRGEVIQRGVGIILGAAVPPGGLFTWYASSVQGSGNTDRNHNYSLLSGAATSGAVTAEIFSMPEYDGSRVLLNQGSSLCVYGLRK